jgi:hypothetical protein
VLCGGVVVGRVFVSPAAPEATPWMWTLAYGYHRDRTPTYGYESTREAAMAAFAKSWRRERPVACRRQGNGRPQDQAASRLRDEFAALSYSR